MVCDYELAIVVVVLGRVSVLDVVTVWVCVMWRGMVRGRFCDRLS